MILLQTSLSPNTGNLLGLLAENGRLSKLETVINAFKIMMAAHRGEVTCEVITAKPLDPAQKQSLEAALKVSAIKTQYTKHIKTKLIKYILSEVFQLIDTATDSHYFYC